MTTGTTQAVINVAINVAIKAAIKVTIKATTRAAIVGVLMLGASGVASANEPLYKVIDGNKVDSNTIKGWHTWRAMACERCHGANQQGLVGPALVDSLKVLTKEQFKTTVLLGRMQKGMPNFNGSKQVVDNIDFLYAFLKGRSDGAIKPGHLEEIK